MGSTVLVGVIEGAILRICHVGNMRAYHLSQSGFRRVTGDHSWVWENLVARGLMQPERVRFHPHRRIITRAIGHKSSKPELTVITLKAGDRVLLCSDGLWEALPNEMIAEIVGSPGSMEDLATILVDAANASGGEDNITAVLYQHTERSKLDGGRAGRIRPALLV
jgi:protein phosphatase